MTVRYRYARSKRPLLCTTLLTLALLTGCGGEAGGGSEGEKSTNGAGSASGGKDDSPGSGKAAPSPDAADGSDTGACRDAECEVVVEAGDVLRPKTSYGVQEFTVELINKGVVSWRTVFTTGSGAMQARGSSVSSTSCTGGECNGRLGRTKGRLETDKLIIDFDSIDDDSAVAKLTAKK
ncbi:hypothetical protein GCM10012287_23650 [Streptomyces daqingensis]|uniref:Lipoprotein n=1 Tax=Streptomyces daqingensis TaxID=1472640 RepID=A0ABQ2M9J2_9ACTN|nr:hypothetical protein GCM10012287_23650 [Streptomyces daqingensis]